MEIRGSTTVVPKQSIRQSDNHSQQRGPTHQRPYPAIPTPWHNGLGGKANPGPTQGPLDKRGRSSGSSLARVS